MNKVIVITGTRKGIGKDLAEYYLEKGNVVVGCSRRDASISHNNYSHYTLDVSDEKSVVDMIKNVIADYGQIDVLINNAGIASMNHLMLTPFKTAQNIMNTNFLGSFLMLREVAKAMSRKKKGNIVNFTTVASPLELEGEAIYASSKAAVEELTKISSKELSKFGITVNAVGPTPVQTDLIKFVPKEKIENLLNLQSIKRFGELKDIINVIDFFIDEKSDFITGQIIYLGGVSN